MDRIRLPCLVAQGGAKGRGDGPNIPRFTRHRRNPLGGGKCTVPEIASITGHSLKEVGSILDFHYLHRDPALGESAIQKLERRTDSPN